MPRHGETNAEERFHVERRLFGIIAFRRRQFRHAAWFPVLLLLWLLICEESRASPCKPGIDAPKRRCLLVEVCDHTGLSHGELRGVRHQVDKIYGRAGINIVWQYCISNRHYRGFLPHEARVYIRDRLSDSFELKGYDLAFDGTTVGDCPGPVIFISRSSVEEFVGARKTYSTLTLVRALGRVLAHELAHRFLQTALHTERGILRSRFSRKELIEIRPCRFFFSEEQVFFLHSYAPIAEDLQALSRPVDDDSGER